MDFRNICEFWSLIKTHDFLVCNIIKTVSYNDCSQIVSISLKTKKSFIAHPWCLLSAVGLEEYSAHDWRAATSVQRAPVTWREWGLWVRLLFHSPQLRRSDLCWLSPKGRDSGTVFPPMILDNFLWLGSIYKGSQINRPCVTIVFVIFYIFIPCSCILTTRQ